MLDFIKKYWFLCGIVSVIFFALRFPGAGAILEDLKILKYAIFVAFLISGLSLDSRHIWEAVNSIHALMGALVSSIVLIPLMALGLSWVFYNDALPITVGIIIIAVCPVTLVSGIVLTDIAKGNVALCILICIVSNIMAIFSMPLSLSLLLQTKQSLDLPVLQMSWNLITVMLVPIMVGQFMRGYFKHSIESLHGLFSVFSQSLVLLIVLSAVATSKFDILKLGWNLIPLILVMILLHTLALVMNWGISKGIRLNKASAIAFIIQTSQKALLVAYLVWVDFFSVSFPLALIPPTTYHLIQIVMDAVIAQRLTSATRY